MVKEETIVTHEDLILHKSISDIDDAAEVIDALTSEHFLSLENKHIFEEIINLLKGTGNLSFLALKRNIKRKKTLEKLDALSNLAIEATQHNLEELITFIKEQFGLRELQKSALSTFSKIKEGNSFDSISDSLVQGILRTTANESSTKLEKIDSVFDSTKKLIENPIPGLYTGLTEFDELLFGFRRKELVVIGGRPSSGKSLVALDFAIKLVEKNNPVIFFSLEMSKEDLTKRLISNVSGVEYWKLNNPKWQLSKEDKKKIAETRDVVKNYPLYINDKSNITLNHIVSKTRTFKLQHPELAMVIIDYLQIMPQPSGFSDGGNMVYSIANLTKGLKRLAKTFDVSVVLLSQLSRDCEKRENKRPVKADLRDSGAIEADADVILFPFRPYMYSKEKGEINECELILEKNRNGNIGTAYVHVDLERQKLLNKPAKP